MEYKNINNEYYVVRIDKDEEIVSKLTELCLKENIVCGSVQGIGASKYVKIGLYDTTNKEYISKVYEAPMEITSLLGNISRKDGEVYLHLHINLCDISMNVIGGHLNECIIGATCEIIVRKFNGEVKRKFNDEIGLNLFEF